MSENIVIIGSGPAGHTAAIYAARAGLKPLMFEGFMAGGIAAGGQLTTTTELENFPGFPEGISGMAFTMKLREQSLKFGVRIITETVEKVDLSDSPFKVITDSQEVEALTIIIATGATARRLGMEGEDRLWNVGVSACAVCDGALPMFRNQVLTVIGGGDSAIEEASHLTRFGSKVYLIHRRDELRASKIMQERAFKNEKIEIIWDTVAIKANGKDSLESITLQNVKTKEERELPCKGMFYGLGHIPNTGFLDGQIETDSSGFIITKPDSTKTSVNGVFACGDVQDRIWQQAITAAGTGCMSAIEAEKFLEEL